MRVCWSLKVFAVIAWLVCAGQALAAQIDAQASRFSSGLFGTLRLEIGFDEIQYPKLRYLDDPYRIVLEFDGLDFGGWDGAEFALPKGVSEILFDKGAGLPPIIIIVFERPTRVAELKRIQGKNAILMSFETISADDFAGLLESLRFETRPIPEIETTIAGSEDLPLIIIDAGHGGADPGAHRGGVYEKDLTLEAAQTASSVLLESGRYRVGLTRSDDSFISLGARRKFGEELNADMFVSLHANTVEQGEVSGTTIYHLSKEASSEAAARFARFENRVDAFDGIYAIEQESDLHSTLIDMAQRNSDRKSQEIAAQLSRAWGQLHGANSTSRVSSAPFAVLKAPEVPSLLLEMGYMTDAGDLTRMQDPAWLDKMARKLLHTLDELFYPELSNSAN